MLSLVGGEEEFQLLEQALAIALFEHGEEPLLERHAPALGADEEVLHQLVGVICRKGALSLKEGDARLEELVVELDLGWSVPPPIWPTLLGLAQPLDQPLHQCMLLLSLEAPLLAWFYLNQDADQLIDFLNHIVTGLELGERHGQPLKILEDMGSFVVRQSMSPSRQELEACHHRLLVEAIQLGLEVRPIDDIVLHSQLMVPRTRRLVWTWSLIADECRSLRHDGSPFLAHNFEERCNETLAEGEAEKCLSERSCGRLCRLSTYKVIKARCEPHREVRDRARHFTGSVEGRGIPPTVRWPGQVHAQDPLALRSLMGGKALSLKLPTAALEV